MKTKMLLLLLMLMGVAAYAQETIQIGNQVWMKYNMVTSEGVWPDGSQANAEYGKLYTWAEAMAGETAPGSQGICPDGFHVPTPAEWRTLNEYLGGYLLPNGNTALAGNAGRHLREAGFVHWKFPFFGLSPAQYATLSAMMTGWDTHGFGAVAAGRKYGNAYQLFKYTAYFWSSGKENGNEVWFRSISYCGQCTPWLYEGKTYINGVNEPRFSLRCLKD